jgi:uncharacterized protein
MKFIYATDLHGDIKKYEDLKGFAKLNNISIIHLGADLLPKGNDIIQKQRRFVNMYLKEFFNDCASFGIRVLSFFGNDDVYTLKESFREYSAPLDEFPVLIEDYTFKAYPFVCDYPFALKSACKLDYVGWNGPLYHRAVDVNAKGFYDIDDFERYFVTKGTIKDDLEKIDVDEKTIMAIHMPPNNLGLDVCGFFQLSHSLRKDEKAYNIIKGEHVGSRSVYDFIAKKQPLLVLCGHIHESYNVTGIWKMNIGRTLVIQPGQMEKTRFVIIDINQKVIKTELVEL